MNRTINAVVAVVFAIAVGAAVGLYAAATLEARTAGVQTATSEHSPLMSTRSDRNAAGIVTDLALSAAERG